MADTRTFTAGVASSTAAALIARRRAPDGLGPALRATARVAFAAFGLSLATSRTARRRHAVLFMGGAHTVHTALVGVYLLRRRPDTGPGRLPTILEIGGGAIGYLAFAEVLNNARQRRTRRRGDLAALYLAGLFAADFANEALRKGPPGRRTGTVSLAVLAAAVTRASTTPRTRRSRF